MRHGVFFDINPLGFWSTDDCVDQQLLKPRYFKISLEFNSKMLILCLHKYSRGKGKLSQKAYPLDFSNGNQPL